MSERTSASGCLLEHPEDLVEDLEQALAAAGLASGRPEPPQRLAETPIGV